MHNKASAIEYLVQLLEEVLVLLALLEQGVGVSLLHALLGTLVSSLHHNFQVV